MVRSRRIDPALHLVNATITDNFKLMNEMGEELIGDEDLFNEADTESSLSTENVSEEIVSSVLSHLDKQVNKPT